MKSLNVVQDFTVFQTFILGIVPFFAGLAWRRYHFVLLSWPEPYDFRPFPLWDDIHTIDITQKVYRVCGSFF
jgi:hypothetical protein